MRPYKKFQHFRKCLGIYFASQNKRQKRKTERKRKRQSSPLTWASPAQLTAPQPKPAAPLVFFQRGGKQLGGRHAAAATPPACLAPPRAFFSCPGDAQELPR